MRTKLPKKRLEDHKADAHQGLSEDEGAHLWAVSYADLLMVLMSFFVIFFSTHKEGDSEKKNQIINIIGSALKNKVPTEMTGHESVPVVSRKPNFVASLADVSKALQRSRWKPEDPDAKGERIKVNLPDNMYKPGEFVSNAQIKASLASIFKIIEPYKEKIEIVLVGHSDSVPLKYSANPYLQDNYALSSLRASHALQYVVSLNYDPKQLYVRASSYNERQSRSLSLELKVREDVTQ